MLCFARPVNSEVVVEKHPTRDNQKSQTIGASNTQQTVTMGFNKNCLLSFWFLFQISIPSGRVFKLLTTLTKVQLQVKVQQDQDRQTKAAVIL